MREDVMGRRRMKERRQHPRIPLIMQVSFTTNGEVYRNYTMNLSKNGMFLATDEPPNVGERLHLAFNIPGLVHPLRLIGEVRWKREKASDEAPSGVGVEFVEMTETCRQLVAEFVDRLVPVSEPPARVGNAMNWSRIRDLYYQGRA